MTRKNIANRGDIRPDALRQRRDLYALSIGLLLFNLAGGKVAANTSFGSILPIALERPWWLLLAAWTGFAYFWFRFSLVSEIRPMGAFLQDIAWQAGDTATIRRLAIKLAKGAVDPYSGQKVEAAIGPPDGCVPKLSWSAGKPLLDLCGLTSKGQGAGENKVPASFGMSEIEIPPEDRLAIIRVGLISIVRAVLRERTFTDYTLPHLFALLTFIVGAVRFASAEVMTFQVPPHVGVAAKALVPTSLYDSHQTTDSTQRAHSPTPPPPSLPPSTSPRQSNH